MQSVDFNDKYLDPPDGGECRNCERLQDDVDRLTAELAELHQEIVESHNAYDSVNDTLGKTMGQLAAAQARIAELEAIKSFEQEQRNLLTDIDLWITSFDGIEFPDWYSTLRKLYPLEDQS